MTRLDALWHPVVGIVDGSGQNSPLGLADHVDVESLVRRQLLQPGVLALELLKPLRVVRLQSAVLSELAMPGRLGDLEMRAQVVELGATGEQPALGELADDLLRMPSSAWSSVLSSSARPGALDSHTATTTGVTSLAAARHTKPGRPTHHRHRGSHQLVPVTRGRRAGTDCMAVEIVLGAPYSNSAFAYFEDITGRGHRGHGDNDYYQALYEPITMASQTITRALLLVSERTHLTPCDFPIPGQSPRRRTGDYQWVPELDLSLDSQFRREAQGRFGPMLRIVERSRTHMSAIAPPIDHPSAYSTILLMLGDIVTATRLSVPLVCGAGWVAAYRRLGSLTAEAQGEDEARVTAALDQGRLLGGGVEAYQAIGALTMESNDLAIAAELRSDDAIRRYASIFVAQIQEAGSIDRLLDALVEAQDSSDLTRATTRSFASMGTTFSIGSLVPGLGTVLGALGVGADLSARVAERHAENLRWWALGPEVRHFETTAMLRRHLDEARRASPPATGREPLT